MTEAGQVSEGTTISHITDTPHHHPPHNTDLYKILKHQIGWKISQMRGEMLN